MILLLVILIALVLGGGITAYSIKSGSKKEITAKRKTTRVGGRLVKMFNEIPKEHRPSWDIETLVLEIDDKYSNQNARVYKHFYDYNDNFSWTSGSFRNTLDNCSYSFDRSAEYCDYHQLYDSMKQLLTSIENRKKAEELAALKTRTGHVASDVLELTQELSRETAISNEAVKKIKELQ